MAVSAHQSNLQLQVEQHPLIEDQSFTSIQDYVVYLVHRKAYEEAARLVAGKSVLDVGCNAGYGLAILASAASSVAGIDVSPRAVEAARLRLGSTADVRLYDGTLCGFPPQSFDAVTSFQVIEHVSEYNAYLSEITRLIRPDGAVLFTTPNALIRLDSGMKPINEFHVREFSSVELKELLLTWFEQVEIRGLFGRDDLYEIERARCESGRISARSRSAKVRQTLRRVVKGKLPWLVPILSALRTSKGGAKELALIPRTEMARFSTEDLFYRSDGLEDALDLMAVCRNPLRKPA